MTTSPSVALPDEAEKLINSLHTAAVLGPHQKSNTARAALRDYILTLLARAERAEAGRDTEMQALRGMKARRDIELRLIERIVNTEGGYDASQMEMEYWYDLHDKVSALRASLEASSRKAEGLEKLLGRAWKWMNDRVGDSWQVHDAVDPTLWEELKAALASTGDAKP